MTDNEVKMWCKLQGTRYWSANNGASHYTLTRKGALTRAFVSAIENAPLTKKEFFKEQGITSDQGYLSQIFANDCRYHLSSLTSSFLNGVSDLIFFCNSMIPCINASGRGGHPGIYTSTGTTISTPFNT